MTRREFFAALAAPFLLRFRKLFGIPAPPVSGIRLSRLAFDPEPVGISIRAVAFFDGTHTRYRFDVLYGVGTIKPEHTCRIAG